jgi:hypothetical protein
LKRNGQPLLILADEAAGLTNRTEALLLVETYQIAGLGSKPKARL